MPLVDFTIEELRHLAAGAYTLSEKLTNPANKEQQRQLADKITGLLVGWEPPIIGAPGIGAPGNDRTD